MVHLGFHPILCVWGLTFKRAAIEQPFFNISRLIRLFIMFFVIFIVSFKKLIRMFQKHILYVKISGNCNGCPN